MIRLATYDDLEAIMSIYAIAKKYMKDNGNHQQWAGEYPNVKILKSDIDKKELFVFEKDHVVHAVFAFIIGIDDTYLTIKEGSWLNNEVYGTIHRIASDGKMKGIFHKTLDYCKSQIDNIRIDTHQDNHTMQHLIIKNGFKACGIIYTHDGSERLAYQYKKED